MGLLSDAPSEGVHRARCNVGLEPEARVGEGEVSVHCASEESTVTHNPTERMYKIRGLRCF